MYVAFRMLYIQLVQIYKPKLKILNNVLIFFDDI